MFAQNVDALHDYEKERKRGELRLLAKENRLMLIVVVVVGISKFEG